MPKRTILLIDEEPDNAELLAAAGFDVQVAPDGEAGLDAFDRLEPELVVVDAVLPKKHGLDVCQQIKRTLRGKSIPVVITIDAEQGRQYGRDTLLSFGCDDLVEKPFERTSLVTVCRRLLGESDAAPAAPEPIEAAAADEALELLVNELEGQPVPQTAAPIPELSPEPATPPGSASPLDSSAPSTAPATPARATDAVEHGGLVDPDAPGRAKADDRPPALPLADAASPAIDDNPETDIAERLDSLLGGARSGARARPAPEAHPAAAGPTRATDAAPATDRPTSRGDAATRKWALVAVAALLLGGAVVGFVLMPGGDELPAVASTAGDDPRPASRPATSSSRPSAHLVGDTAPPSDAAASVSTERPATGAPTTSAREAVASPPARPAGHATDASASQTARTDAPPPPATARPATRPASDVRQASDARPASDTKKADDRRDDSEAVRGAGTVPAAGARAATDVPPPSTASVRPPEAKGSTAVDESETVPVPAPTADSVAPSPQATPPADAFSLPTPSRASESAIVAGSHPAAVEPPVLSLPPKPRVRVGQLMELSEVDSPPRPLQRPIPAYDAFARRLGQQGRVTMRMLIDENGEVADVELIEGIPRSRLNDSAVEGVRSWTYRPAQKDGVAVKVWLVESVEFKL